MGTKRQIRKEIFAKRKALSADLKKKYSSEIVSSFLDSKEFQRADTVFCYVSTEDEVSTKKLLKHIWASGKRAAVPKVIAPHEMEFYEIHGFEELSTGFKGILEPKSSVSAEAEYGVVVVPGVAFDNLGKRIGYGGGFYDTYLQKHPEYKRVAFAFSIQMVKEIPVELHDIDMDLIFTEKGIYRNDR